MRQVPITERGVKINARVQETGGPVGGARVAESVAKFANQKLNQYQQQAEENAYLRGQTAITGKLQELEQKYKTDPAGMEQALGEYTDSFLDEVNDPNMRARFELQLKKAGGAAIAQATTRRQSIINDQTKLSSLQSIDSINRSLPSLAGAITSKDPTVALTAMEAVQENLLRVEEIANQTDANGQFIFTPDQRFKMVNDLKDQVAFQRAVANPDEYEDFIKGGLIVQMPNAGQSTMRTGNRLFKDLKAELGISDAAVAGIVGNLAHESGGFLQLQEIDPLVEGSRGGFGFAQWTGPRRKAFEKWAEENNLDPRSYEANKGFLVHELKNTAEGAVLKDLEKAGNALEATKIFSDKFLRPGIKHMNSRLGWTKKLLTTESEDFDLVNIRDTMSPDMIKLADSTIKKRIEQTRERDVITQVKNEADLLDVINDKSIPLAERITAVKQADFAGDISDGFATEALSVLNDQNKKKDNVPAEERLASFQRMTGELQNLRIAFGGTSEKSGEPELSSTTVKAYKEYKMNVMREVERGALSVSEGKKLLSGVEGAITKAIEGGDTDFEGFRIQSGVQDVYGEALDMIDTYLKGQNASGDIARKRELFLRFSDHLGQFDEAGNYQVTGEYESSGSTAKDEKIIEEAMTRAVMSMNKRNYIGRIDAQNPPNQVVNVVQKAPAVGDVVDGFRFKGGDPANPDNWEES